MTTTSKTSLHVFVKQICRRSAESIRIRCMTYDIPSANVSLESSLPKYVITADGVPVTTYTTYSAQIFCIEKWKNMQL